MAARRRGRVSLDLSESEWARVDRWGAWLGETDATVVLRRIFVAAGEPPAAAAPPPAAPPRAPPRARAESLEAFAARVNAAAARAPGWNGGATRKKLLADVVPAADWPRLWEAHRAGLVTLHRLDLVEAADPAKLAASRLMVQGAEFNLIEASTAAPPRRLGGEALRLEVGRMLDEGGELVQVGPLVRQLVERGARREDVWAALSEIRQDGLIELRPESSPQLRDAADLDASPPGPRGSRWTVARVLRRENPGGRKVRLRYR